MPFVLSPSFVLTVMFTPPDLQDDVNGTNSVSSGVLASLSINADGNSRRLYLKLELPLRILVSTMSALQFELKGLSCGPTVFVVVSYSGLRLQRTSLYRNSCTHFLPP